MRAVARLLLFLALTPFITHLVAAEPLTLEILWASVDVDQIDARRFMVWAGLTPVGSEALFRLTKENVGRKIEVRLDGETNSKALIRSPIRSQTIPITGDFSAAQAREIAERLSAGKSRIEVEIAAD